MLKPLLILNIVIIVVITLSGQNDGLKFIGEYEYKQLPLEEKTLEVKPCESYNEDGEVNGTVEQYNVFEDVENPKAVGSLTNKRNGVIHHCSCPTVTERVDFGQEVYPRYHNGQTCDWNLIKISRNHCKTGLKCMNHFHRIRVLTIKPQNHVIDKFDTLLPHELRQKYFMESKNISIDCRCSY
ncbi:unnamed protein product [Diamesa serratosioi]